jgi:hypothetical protein
MQPFEEGLIPVGEWVQIEVTEGIQGIVPANIEGKVGFAAVSMPVGAGWIGFTYLDPTQGFSMRAWQTTESGVGEDFGWVFRVGPHKVRWRRLDGHEMASYDLSAYNSPRNLDRWIS